jgi:Mrp family chromosome partitioning ATPase
VGVVSGIQVPLGEITFFLSLWRTSNMTERRKRLGFSGRYRTIPRGTSLGDGNGRWWCAQKAPHYFSSPLHFDKPRLAQVAGSAMRTIALVTHKGGSGKTTLAASLAVAAAGNGEKVVALDFDLRRSLTRWARA